jgi:hypothetical protein
MKILAGERLTQDMNRVKRRVLGGFQEPHFILYSNQKELQ